MCPLIKIKEEPMTIELELQIATKAKMLPHPAQFREWISATLQGRIDTAELTIRLVDEAESAQLNEQYRKKEGPTNVLSFPYDPIPGIVSRFIGDIIICAPIVEKEANDLNKPMLDYWAHMVVHGALHLLGYDHELPEEAQEMQELEMEILMQLGFKPPYGEIVLP